MLAGDHVYKMDYARMLVDHAARDADMTIACIEVPLADASAFGVMQVDDDRPDHGLPGKAGAAAAGARTQRHRAREHGHLRVQRARSSTSS